jgi:polysaccharide pyruvyl transferase WcaK-like protein
MNIVIDPGTRNCRNMGDVAMLQVAVGRLRALMPKATISVLVDDAEALARHCPGTEPLPHRGRKAWLDDGLLWGRARRWAPRPAWAAIRVSQRRIRQYFPGVLRGAIRARFFRDAELHRDLERFLERLHSATVFVACGQGTITDAAVHQTETLLDTVQLALDLAVPVVLLGQGVGPLVDAGLRARARAVLPGVSLIALREEREGRPLLCALGVSEDRVVTTGDDAIELAYTARPNQLGADIGIHLRLAPLAITEATLLDTLRPALQGFARDHGARLVPLPISHHQVGTNDPATIRRVLAGFDDASDGGAHMDTPIKVIKAAGGCRMIVTGAYHAAVFGLSQGVSVVCLGRSAYYLDKFQGLRDQFGAACYLVSLDASDVTDRLTHAMALAWRGAEATREGLLSVAERLIERGRAAYARVPTVAGVGTVAGSDPTPSGLAMNQMVEEGGSRGGRPQALPVHGDRR